MPHDPGLDPAAILTVLGVHEIRAITRVTGGADTSLWRVESPSRSYALRVFRAEQAEAYQREILAMQAAAAAQLPVPEIYATDFWHDRPVLLLSWCPGLPLIKAIQRRPWTIVELGRVFGVTQARIHKTPAPVRLAEQRSDWISWAGPEEQRLQTVLQNHAGNAAALLHLDYHPLNVLSDGRRITAILDWANARAGDPRADIARTYTILRVEPNGPSRQSLALAVLRRMFAWSWRHGYEQVAGPFPDLTLFYAWAGAVMVRDLAPRVDNPHSWWQARHLEQIQTWSSYWKRRSERTL